MTFYVLFDVKYALIFISILECNMTWTCICNIQINNDTVSWKREQYERWGLRSEARRILGVVTYVPGPSRWPLPQYKVRNGPFRLMSPYQWGSAIHPKVTIWKEEGIEEHSHRVWGTALHTFTQELQILHAHMKTKVFFFLYLNKNVCKILSTIVNIH